MTELTHAAAQMLMARPWDAAESESIWSVSGIYPSNRGTFTDCLAMALPHSVTGGGVLFKMMGAMDDLISPAWITRATLLILVHADEPGTAYFSADQDYILAADPEAGKDGRMLDESAAAGAVKPVGTMSLDEASAWDLAQVDDKALGEPSD